MNATYMMSKAEREAKRAERTIHATYEGRCQFCGQWTTATQVAHTTFEKLASGDGMCRGKPKGRRRLSIGITPNGFNPSVYPLTAEDRARYADAIAEASAKAKAEGRASVVVGRDIVALLTDAGYELAPLPETTTGRGCVKCGDPHAETVNGWCIRCAVKDAPRRPA